jgi:hypothetical protein
MELMLLTPTFTLTALVCGFIAFLIAGSMGKGGF